MKKIVAVFIIVIALFVVMTAYIKVQAKFPNSIETNYRNEGLSVGFDIDNDGTLDAISIRDSEKNALFTNPGHKKSSTSGIAKNEWYAGFRDSHGNPLPQVIKEDDPRPIVNMRISIR